MGSIRHQHVYSCVVPEDIFLSGDAMGFPARCVWLCMLALAGFGVLAAGAQTNDHPRLMAQAASGQVIACAYSPDGRSVMTGGREGVARLWDAATGEELQSFREKRGSGMWPFPQTIGECSPSAASITRLRCSCGMWRQARNWEGSRRRRETDLRARFSRWEYGGHGESGGNRRARGKVPAPGATKIQFWNLLTSQELKHFLVPGAAAAGVHSVLSPDGSKLFTGDFDGPRLWDVETGKLLRRFANNSEVVSAAAFSADGRRVVWGTIQGTIWLFDLETGKEIQHFSGIGIDNYIGTVDSVVLSPDGRRVLTATNDDRSGFGMWRREKR